VTRVRFGYVPEGLPVVLGSGLALAERLGAIAGMGSRGRNTRPRTRTRPKIRRARPLFLFCRRIT
jgi:hypothetical protein